MFPAVGPNVKENPTANQRREPMDRPVKVCISIDRAFFLRMRPACARPSAGVCNITKVEAIIMKAVSPSFSGSQLISQEVTLLIAMIDCGLCIFFSSGTVYSSSSV